MRKSAKLNEQQVLNYVHVQVCVQVALANARYGSVGRSERLIISSWSAKTPQGARLTAVSVLINPPF